MMKTTLTAALSLGLGLSTLGCVADSTVTSPPTDANGLPLLTAEDQAVVDRMNKGTLAEIELPEGKISFVEPEPGEVLILRTARIGSKLTRIQGEESMTLDQIFRAYAPDRQVPPRIFEAMERVDAADRSAALEPAGTASPTVGGNLVEVAAPKAPDGIESVSSALASSIDEGAFRSAFCNFAGTSGSFCFPSVGAGFQASWSSHRSNGAICGDTGSGRLRFTRSGSTLALVDVIWGQCGTAGKYHGPHDFLSQNLKRTLAYFVDAAQQTVRFSCYWVHGDGFIAGF